MDMRRKFKQIAVLGLASVCLLFAGAAGGYRYAVSIGANQVVVEKPVYIEKKVVEKVMVQGEPRSAVLSEEHRIERAKSSDAISMTEFKNEGVVLLFASDSTVLTDSTRNLIKRKFGSVAGELPKNVKLKIEGHSDPRGERNYCTWLSRERAAQVTAFLVEQYGFKKENIVVAGYGPDRPITRDTAEASRKLNRRVEIRML